MSKKECQQMLNQVKIRVAEAQTALDKDDLKAMDEALRNIRDVLDDCLDRDGEIGPEQQEDDAEKKEGTEEKGCIPDSPHDGYVPGS